MANWGSLCISCMTTGCMAGVTCDITVVPMLLMAPCCSSLSREMFF